VEDAQAERQTGAGEAQSLIARHEAGGRSFTTRGEWIPGWIPRWIPGWIPRWIPGRISRWIPGRISRWIPGWIPGRIPGGGSSRSRGRLSGQSSSRARAEVNQLVLKSIGSAPTEVRTPFHAKVGGGTAKTAQSSASRTAPTASTATGASAAASSPGERTVGTAAAAASQTGEPLQRACYKEGGECLERQDVTLLMSRGPLEDDKRM